MESLNVIVNKMKTNATRMQHLQSLKRVVVVKESQRINTTFLTSQRQSCDSLQALEKRQASVWQLIVFTA